MTTWGELHYWTPPKYLKSGHVVLLMAEIMHQLIGSASHYLQGFVHPTWCRISAMNSITGFLYFLQLPCRVILPLVRQELRVKKTRS